MVRPTSGRPGPIGCLPLALMLLILAPPVALAGPAEAIMETYPALGLDELRRTIDIRALFRRLEYAYRSCDLAAAAALIDFPLVVMTTGPDGRALDLRLGPEEWLAAVEPRFNGQPREQMRRTSKIVLVTDSLARIEDDRSTIARPRSTEGDRRSVVVVRKRSKWLIKAICDRLGPAC